MSKNISQSILFLGVALCLSGCEYLRTRTPQDILRDPFAPSAAEYAEQGRQMHPYVKAPSSVVVCRSHQCAPAKLSMSKEYIYNSLLHLFDNNNYQKALICQGDPASHVCLENYITVPLTAGITPTNAYIDHVKITDVIIGKKANKVNLILNYNLTFGGQVPDCTPSKSIVFAKTIDHVLLEDSGYTCKMTTIGQSTVKTVLAIDYIDLDYGYIGGFYSIGISGPAYGGGNGYMILRLPKNAYPLTPQLKKPTSKNSAKGPKAIAEYKGEETKQNHGLGNVEVFPINKE